MGRLGRFALPVWLTLVAGLLAPVEAVVEMSGHFECHFYTGGIFVAFVELALFTAASMDIAFYLSLTVATAEVKLEKDTVEARCRLHRKLAYAASVMLLVGSISTMVAGNLKECDDTVHNDYWQYARWSITELGMFVFSATPLLLTCIACIEPWS